LSIRFFSALMILLGRPAGRVSLHDEQLRQRGVLDRAVGELPRQGRVLERGLAPRQVTGLPRGLASSRGVDCLLKDPPPLARVLLEELAQLAIDRLLDEPLDRRVAELGLRLALELRIAKLHRDDRGEALADVLAAQIGVLLLQEAFLARVGIQGAGERRAEAGEMRAALVGVDVVCEGEDGLLVGRVPLHRDLDLTVVGLVVEVDGLAVQHVLVLVEVGHEVNDAALVLEGLPLSGAPLVDELDTQVPGQEGGLPEALHQRLVVEDHVLEHLAVGEKRDRRPGLLGLGALLQIALRRPALVILLPDVAVPPDLEVKPLREGVDDRDADPVKAARDLVATAVAELAAGVQRRHHDLGRRALLLLVLLDGDAAAVIGDGDAVVRMQRDADLVAVAGDRLVNRVVDDLVDEVVQPSWAGRPDVHPGTQADGLEPLEDGDVLGAVPVARRAPARAGLGDRGLVLSLRLVGGWLRRAAGSGLTCHSVLSVRWPG
jgi:hypothetical protein